MSNEESRHFASIISYGMVARQGGTAMTERKRGRPVEKPEPDPIPDSPENVLRSLVTAPPRREDEWDYLKRKPKPSA